MAARHSHEAVACAGVHVNLGVREPAERLSDTLDRRHRSNLVPIPVVERERAAYAVQLVEVILDVRSVKGDPGVGAGDFLTGGYVQATTPVAGWEYNMVRWLEREGYDVTYATNIDVHQNPKLLHNHKSFLSVGHDFAVPINLRYTLVL